ncbi:MAG: short-chain dehydrogenase, partial [Symploca sp. SIO1A3]|nr:short-chain dehydrogenase [Symploca sp. SIO1A3]
VEHQNRIQNLGISSIAPEQGMCALEQLLGNQALTAHIAVISIQWSLLAQQWSSINQSSLLQELLQREELQQQELLKPKGNQEILEKLETAPEGERQEILKEYIRGQVAQALGLSSSQLPEVNLGFTEMGIDSLMTVELNNRLQAQLGTTLPVTVILEYPTIEKLSRYISEEVMKWQSDEGTHEPAKTINQEQNVSNQQFDLQALSDEEVEANLMGTLSDMGY